ncbi:glycosyltransferase family 2 protein [Vararia minispora EC-137]|uniref:Glycosyltransferase family 2 protein n=1 Tax=Vararia minispora EC-137 TaxID=1314806 RepID=A0ACB8QG67_9AGAM|nr:glycosyltransferase family 2 protein [Vararia minispora EC-137]
MCLHNPKELYVVVGGGGFIGSHLADRLLGRGDRVRIVDIKQGYVFGHLDKAEWLVGDVLDRAFCAQAVDGAHTVLHLAAIMGGMGVIHSDNGDAIYSLNHAMTQNLLVTCKMAGVKRFFYASSACVYPESLQADGNDVALTEHCVYQAGIPPSPQGLYGLEKYNSENLALMSTSFMDIYIARFHNVFGPYGSFDDGHEKVPAAFLRKAVAIALGAEPVFEIWGDGDQRRSFIFIDNAIDGVLRLLDFSFCKPLNIGSDSSISIQKLAELALECAGVDPSSVVFLYDTEKPTGVAARNSDNTLARRVLGWEPSATLREGMEKTEKWIRSEMTRAVGGMDEDGRRRYLHRCQSSRVVDLNAAITFAILLPITSRGLEKESDCLSHLKRFTRSLRQTTRASTHHVAGTRFAVHVFLAIDHDDEFLLGSESQGPNRAEEILRAEGLDDVSTLISPPAVPRGYVCELWRLLARRAFDEKCDYFVLMGDDVELLDDGWMGTAHDAFRALSQDNDAPAGFGCVAFTDKSFPGMPTFPIVSATHMEIFEGEVVPPIFKNQDGDPFLFQLYRRWGCSRMMDARLVNGVGGEGEARYQKESAKDWTFKTLSDATAKVDRWLKRMAPTVERKLTLDVIIPSYRVPLKLLEAILALDVSPTCTVMFIIIVDNPSSTCITELEDRFGLRPDVRIRVNAQNLGASLSRNRGLRESAAEWTFFLDDDVQPAPDLLIEAERAIRAAPDAAGFIGSVYFPSAATILTAAIYLAGVLYFWDIASKWGPSTDVPWGVTACLIARRDVPDGVGFSPVFPKTGGGEDIDFCRRKRACGGGKGFLPAPNVRAVHPWWDGGRPALRRFFMWSVGDGALIKMYPSLTYRDAVPNSAELLLLAAATAALGVFAVLVTEDTLLLLTSARLAACVFMANVSHDVYRHLWRDPARLANINTSVRGAGWFAAVLLSAVVRMSSEAGRTWGILCRRELDCLGKRFEWFAWRRGNGPMEEEKRNSAQRFCVVVLLFAMAIVVS